MWRIYKEGQGKWARGLLAFVVGITAIYAAVSLHNSLPEWGQTQLPFVRWSFEYRFLVTGPFLVAALVFGVWIFNHPPVVDFLIDTENELKTKVTWPTKTEALNASVVVVVTVAVLGAIVLLVDLGLVFLQGQIYPK
ncbi:MAG: preprotein translocase subunit SecE [Planctomycetota bacterium]